MNNKELIRRALLGDKQAQEECTEKGIVLPCPFCGEEAQLISEKGLYTIVCKDYCAIIGLNQKDLENQGILA